ncbi:hypothetical protein THAOC_25929 [Thalassiosira oceanica]|uniref:Uncharacterized protein n=1 Tax=Thalassiosira oceanica TaxID=159749 RepID=K0S044_THAOC|nr:hypothetical protein THAOC_25929 [Thalassiosira oceanica]|eukprot:EJK54441.1 hypothetical protein THAOC_25929 [Thalassiosira oceanica]
MPATFRRPFPHTTELTGYRRQRLDDQRPHPHGHYRSERDFYRVAASHQGFCGGYWTGEAVDRHDLVRLEPSQLQQNGLGLCLGDQIAVLHKGRWVAGFVGVIGDPDDAWSTMLSAPAVSYEQNGDLTALPLDDPARSRIPTSLRTTLVLEAVEFQHLFWEGLPLPRRGNNPKITCIPPPNEPFIDITVSVADGQGISGRLLDERQLLTDPRNWRNNFCCSYDVVRVFRSELHFLREIDGATVVINRETKEVLRRLSTSPSQQEAFLLRMPVQRRYPEESVGRNYGRSGHRDGLYGSRSQREPSRNQWSASRMPSDDSSNRSCRQEAPRFTFSGGTFRGCPVGPNYKPASKSQKPVAELKSASKSETAVESEPMVELKPVVKSKPAVVSEPVVESKPAVASTPALASKPVVKSKPAVAPTSVVNPKSADGPVSSFLKFVQSLADPTPAAAVPKPAVKSPSVVQSTPAVKSKSDIDSESLVAPPPVVELPPRPAAAPDQHDAIGFAEGWTSRTSRARREPSPTSDDLHSLAVAECVKKYVKVQQCHKPRPRPRRLRATSHASKKDGDQFHAARQTSLPVGTTARRQFDGRSLDRRDERCRGKSGRPPSTRPPSATFMASDDEVFFRDDGLAYRWGALSMDPKLVGSFSHSSLTLVADPLVESAVTPVSVPTTPRVRKPLTITKPPSVTSTTATPVVPAPISAEHIGDVPPPPTVLGHHSPEGVGDVEDRVPEGAVGSTVDPSAVASTKAAVDIGSRRASAAPAIVSEGARAEQGPIGGAVSPGDAIRRFFHGNLPWT